MAVRVRLTRVGSKKNPIWRVVVADQRSPRDGRYIEAIGQYNPQTDPSIIRIDEERLQHWVARGAQPSGTVKQLMKAQAKSGGPDARGRASLQLRPAEAAPEAEADPRGGRRRRSRHAGRRRGARGLRRRGAGRVRARRGCSRRGRRRHHLVVEDLLEYLVRSLVDEPDEVSVERVEEDDGTVVLELRVAEDDAGKVIGRGGRTVAALRTVMKAVAVRHECRVLVDVVD